LSRKQAAPKTKGDNRVAAAERVADARFWDSYERLPRLLRAALQEAVLDWSSTATLQHFTRLSHRFNRAQAEDAVLRAMDAAEERELREFARVHGGGYSAHLAAGATILRYGAE
jgi:hypothetical protein